MKRDQLRSKCCNSNVMSTGDETSYWSCEKCSKPCDTRVNECKECHRTSEVVDLIKCPFCEKNQNNMTTTDQVIEQEMIEFDKKFGMGGWWKTEEYYKAQDPGFITVITELNKDIKSFIRSFASTLIERERERIRYKIMCKNCNGSGNTDSLDGAYECNQCGGDGHLIKEFTGTNIDDLLAPSYER